MRPRWRKVLSDLWGNRQRSLLVVASITVGLFAVGVIATLHLVLSQDMRAGYAATNPANVVFSAASYDRDLVDHMRREQGVRNADGARTFSLRYERRPGEWFAIDIKAVCSLAEMETNQVRLEEGSWPQKSGQIALDRYKLPETNAQVGDRITLELPSGKKRSMELVGVVHDQSIGSTGIAAGFFLAPVQGYIRCADLEWLEQPDSYNRLFLTLEGDTTSGGYLADAAARLSDAFERHGGIVLSTATRSSYSHPNLTFTDAIVGVLFVLGLLVVFLSGFLITNTLQALLAQQMGQIGIMKTVGARREQIAAVYMTLLFIFGLLAFAVALPASYLVSFWLAEQLAVQISFVMQGARLMPEVAALLLAIALIMPQLAALVPIWRGARLSVVEAISGQAQSNPAENPSLKLRLRGISRPLIISLRNTFRRKGRLILTLLTLSLGGAVFIATFNVQVSLSQYTDRIGQYYLADVNLTLDAPYRLSKVEPLILSVPGIAAVEGWAVAGGELVMQDDTAGEDVFLIGPPAETSLVKPILQQGRWIVPGDKNAIVLTDLFKTIYPDLEPGDSIRLRVYGKEADFVVVGFFQLAGRSGGYLAYTSFEHLSVLVGLPNQAVAYRVVAENPNLTLEEQEALGRELEKRLGEAGIGVVDMEAGLSLSKTAGDGFAILTGFLLFLAVLTALVGSIGLSGAMSMNVMERTREIGVMRAIGASNQILMKMVIVEGLLIGMISWLLGSLLAFPISTLLSNSISLALFDAPSDFGFTLLGFLLWLAAAFVLSILASVLPAGNAARLTIREVLAYE
jgi:putative ABC transport system permease protein